MPDLLDAPVPAPPATPRPDPVALVLRALAKSSDPLVARWAQRLLDHGESYQSDPQTKKA